MKKRLLAVIVLCMMCAILVCSCGKSRKGVVVGPVETVTDAETETETKEVVEQHIVIKGIERFKENEIVNGTNDVYLAALISSECTIKGLKIIGMDFYVNGDDVLLGYTLVDDSYTGNEEYVECTTYEVHLATLNMDTYEIQRDIIVGDTSNVYLQDYGDYIWAINNTGEVMYGEAYDFNLEKKYSIETEVTPYGYFSNDGKRYYYNDDVYAMCYDVVTKKTTNVTKNFNININSVDAVYIGDNGDEMLMVSCMAGDLNNYKAVINVTQNAIEYIQPDVTFYIPHLEEGACISTTTLENSQAWGICRADRKPIVYEWQGLDFKDLQVTDNGDLFFYASYGNNIEVLMYDGETDLCMGRTLFDIYDVSEEMNTYMTSSPVYLDENTVLMTFRYDMNGFAFYIWDMTGNEDSTSDMWVYEYAGADDPIAPIDDLWNLRNFRPQELSYEYKPLRDKADMLEEKYDVEIHIGTECSNMIGGYAITALTDYDMIERALGELEYEMDKYPDGFYAQLKKDGSDGLDIYLTADLTGTDEYTLSSAGGFKTSYNGSTLLAIDAQFDGSIGSTFHHELSHSIDTFIANTVGLDENTWYELNPYNTEVMYTMDYSIFGYDEYYYYTYDYHYGDWVQDYSDVYFVDGYSMTYPTEDRSRLWENIMCDDSIVDWENAPHLRAKLNYYCELIRGAFNTSGWGDVQWEKYMNE